MCQSFTSRKICSALLAFLLISANLAVAGWPDVEYTEVRAYYYHAESNGSDPILKDGKLHPTVANRDGALLTANQAKRLLAALDGKEAYVDVKCYRPHHGFICYDRDQHPVAVVEICLDCMASRINPQSKGRVDYLAIADLLEELKLPLGPAAPDAKTYRERRKDWRSGANNK